MSGSGLNKGNAELPAAAVDKKASLVELKNGRVNFKQKPLSFEKQSETLQEIVQFRAMLEERVSKQDPPFATFPEEHKPVVAKLAHESDKSLAALAKHIHHELLPTLDDEEDAALGTAISAALPLHLVENAIKAILIRNNYGLDAPLGIKFPAVVCVWRWEVRSEHLDWLPRNSRERAETRLGERVQAKEDLKLMFEALSKEERDAIIDPKKTSNKLPTKELNKPETTPKPESKTDDAKNSPQSSKKQGKKKADEPENDNQGDTQGRPKKAQDPEKAAKEKERLERKAARAEKEKKEREAHNKSQSIMAKFFSKPKANSNIPKTQESAVAGPSSMQSDFERTFKPFVLQKEKVLAPQNWFLAEKKRKRRAASHAPNTEVIVIDSDDEPDVEMQDSSRPEQELTAMSSQERLQSILSNLPPSAPPWRSGCSQTLHTGFKTYHPVSVRDFMSQLTEAEIGGNDDLVRDILTKLRDRDFLPAKAFCFHEDARPGYFGTWTRSSKIIGPRTPFARDTLVFDYGYDSGEEWEEEPVGEDVADDAEEEEADADDQDSDMESWLVDDDEEPDLTVLGQQSPPPLFDQPTALPKRKAEDAEHKIGKKRKVVVPLVPFAKGPVWESTIGQRQYEPFNPYAIQLFNDTPLSINPFTFVSTCLEDHKTNMRSSISTNTNGGTNDGAFAVPALPPRLAAANGPTPISSNLPGSSTLPKKVSIVTKSVFPNEHMTFLLNKINQLQASSITALVEAIFQELREHKVKKIAIEAKVREVGEKCKEKKVWIVKPALMQQAQTS